MAVSKGVASDGVVECLCSVKLAKQQRGCEKTASWLDRTVTPPMNSIVRHRAVLFAPIVIS